MSFECDACHLAATGRSLDDSLHMFRSRGRCETCGETASCGDCQCPGDWATPYRAAVARRAAAAVEVHKATPQTDEIGVSTCRHCGQPVKRVTGGQGLTWIHEATGAVAGHGAARP